MNRRFPLFGLQLSRFWTSMLWAGLLGAVLLFGIAACQSSSGGGSSGAPAPAAAPAPTPPAAPTGLAAAAADAQVTLTWTAVADATSYNLYWGKAAGVTPQNGTQLAGGTSPYVHKELTNGTTYYYIVTAVGAGGESAASAEANAKPQVPAPGAPKNLAAAAGIGKVTLSWDAVNGASGYNLYRSTKSGAGTTGTPITKVTSPHVDSPLTPGTPVYYVVTALNPGGESPASAQAGATPIPPANCGDAATCLGSIQLILNNGGLAAITALGGGDTTTGLACLAFTGPTGSPGSLSFTLVFANCVFTSGPDSITVNGNLSIATTLASFSLTSTGLTASGTANGNAVNFACAMNLTYVYSPVSFSGMVCGTAISFAVPLSGTALMSETLTPGVIGSFGTDTYALATTPGTTYAIALYEMTANVDLFVSADGISGTMCTVQHTVLSGPTPEDCTITAPGYYLQLKVSGTVGGSYKLIATTAVGSATSLVNETAFALTLGAAHAGFVAALGTSTYSVSGLAAPVTFVVFGNQGSAVALSAFSDEPRTIPVTCDEPLPGSLGSSACTVYHPPATIYLQVGTGLRCEICLPIPAGYVLLAASANRTLSGVNALAVDTPTTGTTQPGYVTVYQVTSPNPSTTYTATVYGMNSGYAALLGSLDNASSSTCGRFNINGGAYGPVDCALTTLDTGSPTLYFSVVGAPGANYTIQVDPTPAFVGPLFDNGAAGEAIQFSYGTIQPGGVSDGMSTAGFSYYKVDVSGAGGPVVVSMSQIQTIAFNSNSASMLLYSDNLFTIALPCDGGTQSHLQTQTSNDCILNTPPSIVYIKTFGTNLAGTGRAAARYILAASPLASGAVSTLAGPTPRALTVGTPLAGAVAWGQYAPFLVSGLTPGSSYVASMAGVSADLTELGFVGAGCFINNTSLAGNVPEDCAAPAIGAQQLVAVGGYDASKVGHSGNFEILVAPQSVPGQGFGEGSLLNPMPLTAGSVHAGYVAMCESSYYVVSGLTGATLVSLSGIGDGTLTAPSNLNAVLGVFTDSSFPGAITCNNPGGNPGPLPQDVVVDAATVAGADGTLYLEVSEVLDQNNTGYTLTVQPAP
jgi:hypothetical protein